MKKTPAPVQTHRARLLDMYGAGNRPCVTAANHWLGCTHCKLPCLFVKGSRTLSKDDADAIKEVIEEYAPKACGNWASMPRVG